MIKRHRIAAAGSVLALLAGVGATGATHASAATKSVTCPKGLKIAFLGALSGDNGALGQNMVNGAQVAFDDWNKANKNCQVEFAKKGSSSFDSQGDPAQASPLGDKLVGDKKIVALIGPGFSGETKATMPKFEEAGLPMITPGATNALLSTNGWKMFHRILANDDKQGPGIAKLIKSKGAKAVAVVDDASEYGKGLADTVRKELGALNTTNDVIDAKGSDFSAAVNKVKAANVDFVFYGGYYAEAAKFVKQLRDAGVKATFVAGDGVLDQKFIDNAGASAEGSLVTATGAPADINPAFQAKFKAKFGTDPAIYSPEAYDCATVFLNALKAGKTTRKAIAAFVASYNQPGITKQIQFTPVGEVAGDAVYSYQVTGAKLKSLGQIK
jgi:branched-chain amino acid transport system substrate-binding protein